MVEKITKLTEEQLAQVQPFVRKWVEIGLSCEPANFEVCKPALAGIYKLINKPAPMVLTFGSPYSATVGGVIASLIVEVFNNPKYSEMGKKNPPDNSKYRAAYDDVQRQLQDIAGNKYANITLEELPDVRSNIRDNYSNYRAAQLWASWYAYVSFFRDVCDWQNPILENFALDETLALNCGWVWFGDHVAAVSDRPKTLLRDNSGRLHAEEGPALEYRDGWSIYAWHGFQLPDTHTWLITEKSRITPDYIDSEGNAELRRIALEVIGFEKYLAERNFKEVAKDETLGLPRRLLQTKVQGEVLNVIEVTNGTIEPDGTRKKYMLGALRDTKTPHEAVAASYGRPASKYKEVVRT